MKPPAWLDALVKLFLPSELYEELLGDLHEQFAFQAEEFGAQKARWMYFFEVIRFCRPYFLKRRFRIDTQYSTSYIYSPTMIRNYFKIAWRNLLKNKVSSLINIIGLALGLACFMAIGLFIYDEINFDRFHTKGKDIFRVVEKQNMAGVEYDIACSPGPLAPALQAEFGEVVETCRTRRLGNRMYKIKDKIIEVDESYLTDNSFFNLFDFKLILGDKKTVLQNPDDIVISEVIAKKLFGDDWKSFSNLIGQTIFLNEKRPLKLVGVVENAPLNSHIQYEVLMSVKEQESRPDRFRWDNNDYHTYIQLNDAYNSDILGKKIRNYLLKYESNFKSQLILQPFHDIYLKSDFDAQTDWSKTSNILYIKIFSIVALILLLIAVFNFFNLTTAQAVKRANEVGVRKAIGAVRTQLISQFLIESILMTILAVILALVLLNFLIPLLNSIAQKSISIPYFNPFFVLFIISGALLMGVISGVFPSFYVSNFEPIKVLKGQFVGQSGQFIRRSLVVIQFTLSIVLIIGTMLIYQQMSFMQNKDLGFDKSQLISVKLRFNARQNVHLIKSDLLNEKSIHNVALSSNTLIDVTNGTHSINWEGQQTDETFLMGLGNVDANYVKTTGMKLIAGRNFDSKFISDTATAFIINESAAKRMGWKPEEAIGKNFKLWSSSGQIIGVIKDFHFHKLNTEIEPFLLRSWAKEEGYNTLMIKTKPNQNKEAIAAIEKVYKKYEKHSALHFEFVDKALEKQYLAELRTGKVILFFSVLAILVSCLGLFGLTIFSTEQRIKEIGIRKVLGASVLNVSALLSKDFIKLVLIAIVIACPIAYYFMDRWLDDFAYKINIEWWVFAAADAGALMISLLTVSFQTIKAALMNPVKSLKTE
ncbi:FtsX-like permease family protein [Runella sp. SP2]|uniref:FtsX-like permease family protein n=1 Tax=Runella sp. SP2 TaxID=2268026 RepID=UPI000F077CC9|nr:FtsX-like permease family protein [Runella sp. SP2]AYQ34856.1 ABC transporter permease [Runella sp. SP2]